MLGWRRTSSQWLGRSWLPAEWWQLRRATLSRASLNSVPWQEICSASGPGQDKLPTPSPHPRWQVVSELCARMGLFPPHLS